MFRFLIVTAWLPLLTSCVAQPPPTPPEPPPPPADTTPPTIFLAERSQTVAQGATLAVFLRADEPATLALSFLDRPRELFPGEEDTQRALVGIPIRTAPGSHPLSINATDTNGNQVVIEVPVEVIAVDWPKTGKLPMSKSEARVEPEAVKRMRTERDSIYATVSPQQRWTGPFQIPVEGGTHTSVFGAFREYPDGSRNHHDAEDIARRRGVPIVAAADGQIALAHHQEMHGNAVLIDHGHKVIGLYSHLHELAVSPGQFVKQGDPIGTMGSTGRTTGPHLHWGLVVDEVAVDPLPWTQDPHTLTEGEPFRVVSPTP